MLSGLLFMALAAATHPSMAQDVLDDLAGLEDVQRSVQYSDQLQLQRLALDDLQSRHGPFDAALREPLRELADLLIEGGFVDEAIPLLEQQLQIERINDGLYSSEQIALLEQLMLLYAREHNWQEVGDQLAHISWLHSRDDSSPLIERLQGLQRVRDWHLYILNNDVRQREAAHLVRIREVSEQLLQLATEHYPQDDPALVEYIYDRAQADLYIALGIMLTSETSPALITMTEGTRGSGTGFSQLHSVQDYEMALGPRVSTVIDRTFRNNMGRHLGRLREIREYYAQRGDTEAEAMAVIHMGDSLLMRDQYERIPVGFAGQKRGQAAIGSAARYYNEAIELLIASGRSQEQVQRYFSCPVLLPVNDFESQFVPASACVTEKAAAMDLGDIHLLVDTVPGPPDMVSHSGLASEPKLIANVHVTVLPNGQPSRVDVLHSEPEGAGYRARVRRVVENLQFRPVMADGRPQRSGPVTMRLHLPQ